MIDGKRRQRLTVFQDAKDKVDVNDVDDYRNHLVPPPGGTEGHLQEGTEGGSNLKARLLARGGGKFVIHHAFGHGTGCKHLLKQE